MMRVGIDWLKAALNEMRHDGSDAELQNGVRMLLSESARDVVQIESWIRDEAPQNGRFGLIAAGRMADPHLLEFAAQSENPELRECAASQLHFNMLRQRRHER